MPSCAAIAARNLQAVRDRRPLVHNITNLVVMNFTANALLAMGASPVMAHAASEVEEIRLAEESLRFSLPVGVRGVGVRD